MDVKRGEFSRLDLITVILIIFSPFIILFDCIYFRMLVYEDNHSLSSGTVEMDHLVNAGLWFLEHLN